jgi:peptidoglycan/LPS O-acetylase OafA/YrhL
LEPAYIVSIAAVVLLWYASSMAPGFAGGAPDYSLPQLASHLFYVIPLTSYNWLNPVYWSLAYEFVFYITVGLTFAYLIERRTVATVLLALVALGLSFAVYSKIDVRIIEFLVGALLMRLVISNARNVETEVWLVISLALVFLCGGTATGIAVALGAGAIYFLRDVEFGRCAILLGGLSYSLYLMHVPIGGRVINLGKRFGDGPLYELGLVALALLASLLAAALLHRLIEKPALMMSRRVGKQVLPAG